MSATGVFADFEVPGLRMDARVLDFGVGKQGFDRGMSVDWMIDRRFVRTDPCGFVFRNFTMDYDLILRLAKWGEVRHIRKYVAALRMHPASKTAVREELRLPMESRAMRLKYLPRPPLPFEPFILRCVHTSRLVVRMLVEGCFASRFGKGAVQYVLNGIYTPEHHSFLPKQ